MKEGFEIEIGETLFAEYFNSLKMLQFSAIVFMGGMALRDTTFVGVHGNQMVRITLNYVDGDLDDTARIALEEALSTLTFE